MKSIRMEGEKRRRKRRRRRGEKREEAPFHWGPQPTFWKERLTEKRRGAWEGGKVGSGLTSPSPVSFSLSLSPSPPFPLMVSHCLLLLLSPGREDQGEMVARRKKGPGVAVPLLWGKRRRRFL